MCNEQFLGYGKDLWHFSDSFKVGPCIRQADRLVLMFLNWALKWVVIKTFVFALATTNLIQL